VSEKHLAAIVYLARECGRHMRGVCSIDDGGVALYKMFAQENADSVEARYDEPTEPVPVPERLVLPAIPLRTVADVAAAIKLVDCYEYQTNDAPDYEESDAASWCRNMRRELMQRIPGFCDAYMNASWSI
jgi:hypothetical protein